MRSFLEGDKLQSVPCRESPGGVHWGRSPGGSTGEGPLDGVPRRTSKGGHLEWIPWRAFLGGGNLEKVTGC